MNRTTSVKAGSIERAWYVVDATDVPVGRLATEVAKVLRGKHKPTFAYNADCGDFVIVINAERAAMSGNKKDELIQWHTGWPGGLKAISRGRLQEKDPVRLIERAIWGMTCKTKLGHQIIKKLKVYAGPEHPHAAQEPKPLAIAKR